MAFKRFNEPPPPAPPAANTIAPGWYMAKLKDRTEKEVVLVSLSPYTKRLCLFCVGDTEARPLDDVEAWGKFIKV